MYFILTALYIYFILFILFLSPSLRPLTPFEPCLCGLMSQRPKLTWSPRIFPPRGTNWRGGARRSFPWCSRATRRNLHRPSQNLRKERKRCWSSCGGVRLSGWGTGGKRNEREGGRGDHQGEARYDNQMGEKRWGEERYTYMEVRLNRITEVKRMRGKKRYERERRSMLVRRDEAGEERWVIKRTGSKEVKVN